MAVRNAIQKVSGVSNVTVEGTRVTVSHQADVARESLAEAVKRAGYQVVG